MLLLVLSVLSVVCFEVDGALRTPRHQRHHASSSLLPQPPPTPNHLSRRVRALTATAANTTMHSVSASSACPFGAVFTVIGLTDVPLLHMGMTLSFAIHTTVQISEFIPPTFEITRVECPKKFVFSSCVTSIHALLYPVLLFEAGSAEWMF